MSEQKNQNVEVMDYLEAAVLRAARCPVAGTGTCGDRIVFRFSGDAAAILDRHRRGELTLPTIDLISAVGLVKSEMFNTRRAKGMY